MTRAVTGRVLTLSVAVLMLILVQLSIRPVEGEVLWTGTFNNDSWPADWGTITYSFNEGTRLITSDPKGVKTNQVMRVSFPNGSYNPGNSPIEGGTGFLATPLGAIAANKTLCLKFSLLFKDGFKWVKGGKLPGLYGTTNPVFTGCRGQEQPNGTDCWSSRHMWKANGTGEVYAYILDPSQEICDQPNVVCSDTSGQSIGRGDFVFTPGTWHTIQQRVDLNTPGSADGRFQLWLDGVLRVNQSGMEMRSVSSLQVSGIMFSTFFGGSDSSWATPEDTYIWFADFELSDCIGTTGDGSDGSGDGSDGSDGADGSASALRSMWTHFFM